MKHGDDERRVAIGIALTPTSMRHDAIKRPIVVSGTTSPYPTVVTVTIAHHSALSKPLIPESTSTSRIAATTARESATIATMRTALNSVSRSTPRWSLSSSLPATRVGSRTRRDSLVRGSARRLSASRQQDDRSDHDERGGHGEPGNAREQSVEPCPTHDERSGGDETCEPECERPGDGADAEPDRETPVRPRLDAHPALDEHHDERSRRSGKEHEERDRESGGLQEGKIDAVVVDDARAAERGREDRPERQPQLPRDCATERGVEHAVDATEHRHREHELGRVEREDADLEAVVGGHSDHVVGGRQPQEQHREPAAHPADERPGERARGRADEHPPGDRGRIAADRDGAARCARSVHGLRRQMVSSAASCAVSVGVVPTRIPRSSSAFCFADAVPEDPEMIAPACPIVLPGGAVKPAM